MKLHTRLILFILIFSVLLSACGSPTAPATPTESEHAADLANEDILATQIATWDVADQPTLTPAPPTGTVTPYPTAAQPTATQPPSPDDWQQAPVFPTSISQRAIDIYTDGLSLGRNPAAFAKVGDCGGTPSWFLGAFDLDPQYYRLGEFDNLTGVIAQYTGSWERYSLAVSPGFNTSSVFASLWADPQQCNSDEGPLACEYRLQNPSVALIMLGTNDYLKPDEFEEPLRQIIEYSIEQGVLPILASKPDNLEGDYSINRTIYKLALEYELPFWNLWSAFQPLPNGGLQEDNAHLTWAPNFFDDPNALQAGWPWRNLTALQVLDAVWRALPTP